MKGKKCLAVRDPKPERFGTVSHAEGDWTIVIPFNEEMEKRALALGPAWCVVVYR